MLVGLIKYLNTKKNTKRTNGGFLWVSPNSKPIYLLASLCYAHIASSLAHTTQYTQEASP